MSKHLEFGDFLLDVSQRTLWRDGKRVPLSPRPFAMLLILVENRHRVVSKDELLARVWPEVIVEESNIATNIRRLRQALSNGQAENGEADARQYIETISGYGYQFVAKVSEREEQEVTDPPSEAVMAQPPEFVEAPTESVEIPLPKTTHSPRRQIWRYGAVGLAILVVAATAWIVFRPKRPFIDLTKLRHQEIISWKNRFGDGIHLLARPSPDGRAVAYVKSEDDQPDIFIQELGTRKPVRITTVAWPDYDPIWSADSKQIAYQSKRESVIELAVINLLTRQRTVVRTFPREYAFKLLRWSGNDRKIFYTDQKNVFALSLNSQETINLTNFKGELDGPSLFGLSFDEEKIAYVKRVNGIPALFAARLDGRQTEQLGQANEFPDYPEWFADNEHILYGSSHGNSQQISVIGLHGDAPIQLLTGHEAVFPYSTSADGKRLFYAIEQIHADLFRLDIKDGSEIGLALDPGLKAWPEVSPDGQNFAFQRTDKISSILHSLILSSSMEVSRLPVELVSDGFDPRWSPKGGQLAFLRFPSNKNYQLWLLEAQTLPPRLLTDDIFVPNGLIGPTLQWDQPSNYSWSPDGTKLAYCTITDKIWSILTVGAKDHTKERRSQNSDPALRLTSPLWSPDGTRIAYLAQTGRTGTANRAVVINDGVQDRTILHTDLQVRMIGWTDSEHLLVGLIKPGSIMVTPMMLKRVSLTGVETQEVIDPSLAIYFGSLRLSPDGKTLALTARQDGCDNIYLYSMDKHQIRKLTANKEPHIHLTGLGWFPNGRALCFSKQSTSTSIWMMENLN